ncbi:phage tail protein [Pseudaestuariivita rosea]|uniref:phage tail protein n=1 Tax=Pseudaestuariivita rosea TaxID=2763263 RepID=UPI001ABA39B8|nr:phage tail protein [Pseudaestuariivita rosea]
MNADQIAHLLPEFWRDARRPNSPQDALFDVMAGLLTPAEHQINTIDVSLDPLRCPKAMLPFLVRMMGLEPLLPFTGAQDGHIDTNALRLVLAEAPHLLDRRGTNTGIMRALTLAVGPGFMIDETSALAGQFHVTIQCPDGTQSAGALIDAVTRLFKPAHITHDLRWPDPDE